MDVYEDMLITISIYQYNKHIILKRTIKKDYSKYFLQKYLQTSYQKANRTNRKTTAREEGLKRNLMRYNFTPLDVSNATQSGGRTTTLSKKYSSYYQQKCSVLFQYLGLTFLREYRPYTLTVA